MSVAKTVGEQQGPLVGKIAVLYLFLTVVGYWVTGGIYADWMAIVYAGICFSAFAVGWLGTTRGGLNSKGFVAGVPRWMPIVAILAILGSGYNISTYYADWSTVLNYLGDPGAAYERVKFMRRNGLLNVMFEGSIGSLVGVTMTLLGWTRLAAIATLSAFWNQVGRGTRWLLMLAVGMFALETLLIGAMVNILIGLMAALPGVLLRVGGRRLSGSSGAVLSVALVLGLLAVGYFRGARDAAVYDSWAVQIVNGLSGLVFYGTNGYQGLAYCLRLPFVFSWGQGTFPGIMGLMDGSLGGEALTFPARSEIETGWSSTQLWSTAFAWVASDVTFVVVPALMLLFGILMRNVAYDAFVRRDFAAVILFGHLVVATVLLPANNYLLNTLGTTATTFVFGFFYWRSSRRRWIAGKRAGSRKPSGRVSVRPKGAVSSDCH